MFNLVPMTIIPTIYNRYYHDCVAIYAESHNIGD